MIVGLLFTFAYILMCTSHKVLGTETPMLEPENYLLAGWFGLKDGINPQGIGTIGMLLNFIVTSPFPR